MKQTGLFCHSSDIASDALESIGIDPSALLLWIAQKARDKGMLSSDSLPKTKVAGGRDFEKLLRGVVSRKKPKEAYSVKFDTLEPVVKVGTPIAIYNYILYSNNYYINNLINIILSSDNIYFKDINKIISLINSYIYTKSSIKDYIVNHNLNFNLDYDINTINFIDSINLCHITKLELLAMPELVPTADIELRVKKHLETPQDALDLSSSDAIVEPMVTSRFEYFPLTKQYLVAMNMLTYAAYETFVGMKNGSYWKEQLSSVKSFLSAFATIYSQLESRSKGLSSRLRDFSEPVMPVYRVIDKNGLESTTDDLSTIDDIDNCIVRRIT